MRHATLNNNTLTLDTGRLRRTCRWNDGHLATTELCDTQRGVTLTLPGDVPDVAFPGLEPAGNGEFHTHPSASLKVVPKLPVALAPV